MMYKIPKPGLYKNCYDANDEIYIYVSHITQNEIEGDFIFYYVLNRPDSIIPIRPYVFNASFKPYEKIND